MAVHVSGHPAIQREQAKERGLPGGGKAHPIRDWFVERLGLRALAYPVPEHANGLLYTLGGITLFGFAVLIITGIWLAQFYHPHPTQAHDSVLYIMKSAPLGDFVRGVHAWSAVVVTVTISLHMVRVFLSGSYKAPREANWLVGLGLLAVTMGFVFTGTVAKWDQEGAEALLHNTDIAQLLGAAGGWFSADFSLAVPVVVRVFFAHVAILPALLTALVIAHFFLVKVHGMAPLGRADGREADPANTTKTALYGEPMYPFNSHIRKIAGWGLLATSIIMALALAFPTALGPAPIQGIEVTKPPFMYWWLYAAEDFLGLRGLLIIPAAFFLIAASVPLIDRGRLRAIRRRKTVVILGVLFIILLLALTAYTGLTPPVAHTQM
ncbi:MAG: cytochrome b N-terminal domain-containing protein [Chloroflexota bacterium]|nr:cytochrome b N-terminal domain-containing protein [Chloroflexota bacterium]